MIGHCIIYTSAHKEDSDTITCYRKLEKEEEKKSQR